MIDGKNYTFKEQVQYEFDRIKGDRTSQDMFFGKAISIQNKAWNTEFADGKMKIACEVLAMIGYCNPKTCERCQLTSANERAHKEIDLGLRNHKKYEEPVEDYITFTKDEFLLISKACHFYIEQDDMIKEIIDKIDAITGGNDGIL